jgi:hypothetical protein
MENGSAKGFYFIVFFFTLLNVEAVQADDRWIRVVDLEDHWKFSIGDNKKWAEPNYTDSDWESIDVPAKWEDEGFYGYNGYAWYRKTFEGTALKNKNSSYNLFLGYIDDVDEVYFNGHKIGASGSFPPHYQTAYNALRNYNIPNEYINFLGKNTIAVRVYDSEIEGGIVSGEVGIFTNRDDAALDINLRGMWDFKLADRKFGGFTDDYDDSEKRTPPEKGAWLKITVPSPWENQGYNDYDGTAWYRKQFVIPKSLQGEDLVLILGKIDDYDQTYFNGKIIGATNQWDKLRIYHITSDMYTAGAINILLIYVDDPHGLGGIYEGPVGIMKQSNFTRYMRYRD